MVLTTLLLIVDEDDNDDDVWRWSRFYINGGDVALSPQEALLHSTTTVGSING